MRPRRALEHIAAADADMARAIRAVGDLTIAKRPVDYHLLLSSVIGQSISVKAAAAIVGRFKDNLAGGERVGAHAVLKHSEDQLRALGVTRTKAGALIGLARLWTEEDWNAEVLRVMPDAAVAERLTSVRGIGPWTAKMVLMFGLRRPDVLPHEDLGFQEGLRRIRRLKDRPVKRADIERMTDAWRPWRSVGVMVCWEYLLTEEGRSLNEGGWWNEPSDKCRTK